MLLLRFLFYLFVAWLAWRLLRQWLTPSTPPKPPPPRRLQGGKVVKCRYCEVHLPEAEAVRDGDDWYCSQQHLQAQRRKR
ncbi:MAG TPA: PP0621 family protein [Hyphomicrobiales bacterium]|nr:PP0621 family protein [Hyphomicrobiales bacterium]